ncbi:clathrin adaptor complex small chain subfamily protein [Cardiosporidium cionae]|uniref:Coatomer subunit zeta n=1 Tax=Cardiosporidium cionae TaxID=476202 RepID=A0ABQ7J8E1_9APIC|nr:clathrin adaptor complex small chain subfamily protein [Cardiosporidium cionae]|eukprot:KAF8820267.1 clathrin adaptor complex small chain subfamily protein [Cardiosporidium cionae]
MLRQVIGICILDTEGGRLAVKYYNRSDCPKSFERYSSQIQFEKKMMQKANKLAGRPDVEILMVEEHLVLFCSLQDICVCIIGDPNENELLLLEVVNAVTETLSLITNGHVGKRQLLTHMDAVFLMLDEIIDEGIIFETDPTVILSRINMNEATETSESTPFNQAISLARENLLRSFLSS